MRDVGPDDDLAVSDQRFDQGGHRLRTRRGHARRPQKARSDAHAEISRGHEIQGGFPRDVVQDAQEVREEVLIRFRQLFDETLQAEDPLRLIVASESVQPEGIEGGSQQRLRQRPKKFLKQRRGHQNGHDIELDVFAAVEFVSQFPD